MGFEFDSESSRGVNIKVVGIGGGGGNAIDRMMKAGMSSAELIAINTDKQALDFIQATQKLQIGDKVTKGMGAGASPERGERAAEECREDIAAVLQRADMVFVTAGMGGGTGTGAAPVVASIARELGALTVAVVTTPFSWEGTRRMATAKAGIEKLQENVDSIIIVPNDRLKLVSEDKITLQNAFDIADDVLRQGVQSISDLINEPGIVNLDFADVCSVMKDAGRSHMGVGRAGGADKATEAANMAINSPLLETSINGARSVIINITASPEVALEAIETASTLISQAAHPEANIIWGAAFDEMMNDEIKITVIATGFAQSGVKENFSPFDSKGLFGSKQFASPAADALRSASVSQPKMEQKPLPYPPQTQAGTAQKSQSQQYRAQQASSEKNEPGEDSYFDIAKMFRKK